MLMEAGFVTVNSGMLLYYSNSYAKIFMGHISFYGCYRTIMAYKDSVDDPRNALYPNRVDVYSSSKNEYKSKKMKRVSWTDCKLGILIYTISI